MQVAVQSTRELQRRGYDVTVCAANLYDKGVRIRPRGFEDVQEGIRVIYIDVMTIPGWRGTLGPALLPIRAFSRLVQEIRRCDIVHVNGIRNVLSMAASLIAFRLHKPVVLQPHGSVPRYRSSVHIKQIFDRFFLEPWFRRVHMFLALHEREARDIVDSGADPKTIRMITNGLDNRDYDRAQYVGRFRAAFGIDKEHLLILFSGRIHPIKGVDLLVEAYAGFRKSYAHPVCLALVGDDDGHLERVSRLIEKYDLQDSVVITGLLEGDMVKSAHADADIFVLPSRADSFPMTVVEACQAGTPMVITERCSIASVLDGIVADIVSLDVEAIQAALAELAADRERRRRYRHNSADLMRTQFSISAVGDTLESAYKSVSLRHSDLLSPTVEVEYEAGTIEIEEV